MEVAIRKATAGDYNALCELFGEVVALHCHNLPHVFQKPDGRVREYDDILRLIDDENVGLYVAEVGQSLVGFVHAALRDAPVFPEFVPRRCAVLDGIGVRSEFRDHGIGRMLMDTAYAWALERGSASIELNVYEFNKTAIAFYQRLGFEVRSLKMIKALDDRTIG